MSLGRWAPIESMVSEFQGLLAPIAPQLKIEKGVDCADCYPTHKAVSSALERHGVYLIFDDDSFESLKYIGMALDQSLIHRIRAHRKSKKFIPRWIDIISFVHPWTIFVPSLELYLINRVVERYEGNALVNAYRSSTSSAVVSRLFNRKAAP